MNMNERLRFGAALLGLSLVLWPGIGRAQMHHHPPAPADTTAHHSPPAAHPHAEKSPHAMHGADMAGMDMSGMEMAMNGMYGPYELSREASGTSWQTQAARHEGLHMMHGEWMVMLHGFTDLVYDDQGGRRGDSKLFSNNMGMAMAQRRLGAGTFGLRSMASLEPVTIGKTGYPLLLQTGET